MTYKSDSDGVTMEIEKKDETGKPVVETYTAKDVEEFKAKYPERGRSTSREVGRAASAGGAAASSSGPGREALDAPVPPVPPMPGLPPQTWTPLTKVDLNQPKLGVITSAVPPVLDKQLKLKGEGVVIESVFPDSLASRLGIQELDVLLRLDGQVDPRPGRHPAGADEEDPARDRDARRSSARGPWWSSRRPREKAK